MAPHVWTSIPNRLPNSWCRTERARVVRCVKMWIRMMKTLWWWRLVHWIANQPDDGLDADRKAVDHVGLVDWHWPNRSVWRRTAFRNRILRKRSRTSWSELVESWIPAGWWSVDVGRNRATQTDCATHAPTPVFVCRSWWWILWRWATSRTVRSSPCIRRSGRQWTDDVVRSSPCSHNWEWVWAANRWPVLPWCCDRHCPKSMSDCPYGRRVCVCGFTISWLDGCGFCNCGLFLGRVSVMMMEGKKDKTDRLIEIGLIKIYDFFLNEMQFKRTWFDWLAVTILKTRQDCARVDQMVYREREEREERKGAVKKNTAC